jgi:hypothetical protein
MNETFVVIPAQNEAGTIEFVVHEARQFVSKVIVVNDHSSDETKLFAGRAGAVVLDLEGPSGYSAALLAGWRYALDAKCGTIVTLDADGAHSPKEIPLLLDRHVQDSADLTIGDRFHNQALGDIPSTKRWANYFATALVNHILGTRLRDVACGFRAFSKTYAHTLLCREPMPGFTLAFRSLHFAILGDFRLASAPISVHYDASSLLCTTQTEFLDLLGFCVENVAKCKTTRACIMELKSLVARSKPSTIRIGEEMLCLCPIENKGYIFQRQSKCFGRRALGPIMDMDACFAIDATS